MSSLSISEELIKASRWNILAMVSSRGCHIIAAVILARFVYPTDYGSVAIVAGMTAFFILLTQFGFAQAIVGVRDADKKFSDVLFTISLILAVVFYAALFWIAPLAGKFYNQPILIPLIRVNGLGLLVSLLAAIPVAWLQRELNYRSQAFVEIISSISYLFLTIIMAVADFRVWALIIPILVGRTVSSIVAFHFARYWPAFTFDWQCLRKALNFGFYAFISNVANFFCNNAVPLVLGKMWSSTTLGLYSFAFSKHSLSFDILAGQFTGSLFPILSKISNEFDRLNRVFLHIVRLATFLIPPLYVILIIGAPVFFPVVFGERWNGAILPFQILSIIPLVRTLNLGCNSVLYALGLPQKSAKVVIIRVIGYTAVMVFSLLRSVSPMTVVAGVVVVDVLVVWLYILICLRILRCSISRFFVAVLAPLSLSVFLFLILIWSMRVFDSFIASVRLKFVAATLFSLVICGMIYFRSLRQEWQLFRVKPKDV